MKKNIRVRFAPSPTGNLHIGGVRTALFNWLFARHHNGDFILRIEDTDTKRSSKDSVNQIISAFKWLTLDLDEGPKTGGPFSPYYQSRRLSHYKKGIKYLLENNKAYYCFCSQKGKSNSSGNTKSCDCKNLPSRKTQKLKKEHDNWVIKFKTPASGNTVVKDLIRGKVVFENRLEDDFIIMKSNKMPTYNFACVMDDKAMEISHIIRAEEHLSNTPRQIMLYKALEYKLPEFAHVPMILGKDNSKLSKRQGATSIQEFKQKGYLPEGLLNYLLLLGWSPGGNQEIISLKNAIEKFQLKDISRNPSTYDIKKLTWINSHYMKELPLERILEEALPLIKKEGYLNFPLEQSQENRLKKIIDAVRKRTRTLVELADGISYFYTDDFKYEEKGVKKHFEKENTPEILKNNIDCLQKVEPFTRKEIENIYRKRSKNLDVKAARMIHTTRLALSGRTFGPGLFTLVELMGRKESIKRLNKALKYVNNLEKNNR
ncbi:MAG: glutamate--tRNA ligase [Halanaerobiaceae bacterium]